MPWDQGTTARIKLPLGELVVEMPPLVNPAP